MVRCSLPPCLSKHHISVIPVVATIPSDFKPRANPNEVAAVFDVPLETFVRPGAGRHSHKDCVWDDLAYRLHYFETEDKKFTIWGLTAIILIQVIYTSWGGADTAHVHPHYPVLSSPPTSLGQTCELQSAISADRSAMLLASYLWPPDPETTVSLRSLPFPSPGRQVRLWLLALV